MKFKSQIPVSIVDISMDFREWNLSKIIWLNSLSNSYFA